MQIEDALRPSRLVDLRQRLAVRMDIFADQDARAVILPDQRPAGAIDVMRRVPARDLLRALVIGTRSRKQMNGVQE